MLANSSSTRGLSPSLHDRVMVGFSCSMYSTYPTEEGVGVGEDVLESATMSSARALELDSLANACSSSMALRSDRFGMSCDAVRCDRVMGEVLLEASLGEQHKIND